MIKNQLFISLLLLSIQQAHSRFLQVTPTSNTARQLATTTTYSSTLLCGECILNNYTFCVKGAEGMITSSAPTSYCCQNSSSCSYAKDSAWNCSSKYNTTVDQLRVCPFITGQCGSSSSLNLTGVGDQSCIKINSLQQGNACVYKVKSQCGVPDFKINDTANVVIQYKMISNTTINYTSTAAFSCHNTTQSQACICQNITISGSWKWNCSCANPSNNASVSGLSYNSSNCSCNISTATNKSCNCCVSSEVQKSQLQPVCSMNSTKSNCSCVNVTNSTSKTSTLNCSCKSYSNNVTQSSLSINATNCYCDLTNSTNKSCNCCVSASLFAVASINCSNTTSKQSCYCMNVTSGNSSSWRCNCSSNNVTSMNLNVTNTSCSCNASSTSASKSCLCCITNTTTTNITTKLSCATNSTNQSCSCKNATNATSKTWFWDCNCTRKDNNVTKNFTFANTSLCLNSSGSVQCCVNATQYATQVVMNITNVTNASLTCAVNSTNQSCSCLNVTNATSKTWYWSCNCTRKDNNVTKNFTFTNASHCLNSTGKFQCCVNASQYATQVNSTNATINATLTCAVNSTNQSCACINVTNATSKTWVWSCNCTRKDNNVTKNFTFSNTSHCLNSTNKFQCCVNATQYATQVVSNTTNVTNATLTCAVNSTNQSCACINVTNATSKTWYWSCNCTRKDNNVTKNFTFANASHCLNSTGKFQCCVNASQYATQVNTTTNITINATLTCAVNSTNQSCACINVTNATSKTWYWSCNCTRKDNNVTKNFTFANASHCLNSTGKFQCCVNSTQYTQVPTLSCAVNSTSQNCSCVNMTNATSKTWYWSCNCTRQDNNITKNFTFTNASYCLNSTNKFQCCVNATQYATQVNVTVNATLTCALNSTNQSCACINMTNATSKTWYWSCNCTRKDNNVTKNFTFANASHCLNSTGKFQCCVNASQYATQVVSNTTNVTNATLTCAVNSTNQSCACINVTNATSKTWVWSCNCTRKDNNVTKNFTFSNTSHCLNTTGKFQCCVNASQYATQVNTTTNITINATLTCAVNSTNQSCACINMTNATSKTWYWSCNCTRKDNNVTKNFTFANASHCLNSTGKFQCCVNASQYATQVNTTTNITINATLTCAVNSTNQSCACINMTNATSKTWYWSCNCTRKDNNVTKNFTFANASHCLNSTGKFQCCVNASQYATQVNTTSNMTNATLTCALNSTNQSCACINVTNATSKTWYWSCNCTRKDNNITMNFTFSNTSHCLNSTGKFQCCVNASQQATQVPTLSCAVNSTSQNCSCINVTNATSKTWYYSCNCTRHDNNITKNFTFNNGSSCLNSTGKFACCVNATQMATQVPTLSCAVNSTSQNCSCINVTNATSKTWYYSCNCTRQDNNITKNFTFNNGSSCLNSTGKFACCVNTTQMATQVPTLSCAVNSTSQNCSCINVTNATSKTWYYSCNCTRQDNNITKNFTFNNGSSCLNATNRFQCCVNSTQYATQVPILSCAVNSTAQNCSCINVTNATSKTWYWSCNCTRRDTNITKNFTFSNSSSCLNTTGKFACCVNATQMATQVNTSTNASANLTCAVNSTSQNCSCINVTNATSKTWYWSCNCTRRDNNVTKNFTFSNSSSCLNVTGKFACCVTSAQMATQVNATNMTNATFACAVNSTNQSCACINVTNATSKTWYWSCNCTRKDNNVTKNFTFMNTTHCLNSTGKFQCCVNASQYATQVVINTTSMTCSGNQDKYNCSCKNVTNATTKTWSYSCNCSYKSGNTTANKTGVSFNDSACACTNNSGIYNCSCCYTLYTVDESTCSAFNKVHSAFNATTANNATNCKYQYEYYVAVVATGKNSSVLLQLQSYQLSANYLKTAFMSALFVLGYLLY